MRKAQAAAQMMEARRQQQEEGKQAVEDAKRDSGDEGDDAE